MGVLKREYANGSKPVWYYQFRYQKQKFAQAGFATEREAKEAEQKKWNELHSKTLKPIQNDKVSVSQFIDKFLEHRTVTMSGETAFREGKRCVPVLRHLGEKRLNQITIADIREYVAYRKTKDKLCNRSINLELTLLRSLFKFAIECNFANENPAKAVTNMKEHRDEKWISTPEELQRFVDEAGKTTSAVVFVPWIWFRVYTGTRPKESVFVEWQDIDFQNNRISIRPKPGNQLKNATVRYVEIHPELKPILLEWKKTWHETLAKRHERYPDEPFPPHDWVFFNRHNMTQQAQSFNTCFEQARIAANLPELTCHGFRHYFISHAVMSGVNFLTIAKWVGHKNTKMIEEVYGHLRPVFRQEQMNMVSFVAENGTAEQQQAQPPASTPSIAPLQG